MTDATAAAAPHRRSKLPDVGGFHGKLVQHIFAYAHGLNTVGEAEWVAKVPRLLCRDGWPHASVVAPGAAHRARVARTTAARTALTMHVRRAKLLRAACLNPLYAWLGGRQCFVRHVDLTQIPDADREDVGLPPHLETDETDRLDHYAHRGRAGFLADMDLVANNAAAFVSDTDPATRAVADEAAAIARAAQTACDAGEAPVAAAAPADDATWALKRPIALQTLDVLAVTVAGRADLEAKISELRALIDAPAPVANGVAAPVPEVNGAAAPAAMDPTADVSAREWPLQRLLALRAFEARAWRRRQARIGALDDDAYERGRAFQAYEDLLAELA